MYACLWLHLCLSDDCVNRLVEASYLFISLCIGSKFCEEENALIVSDPPQATPPPKKKTPDTATTTWMDAYACTYLCSSENLKHWDEVEVSVTGWGGIEGWGSAEAFLSVHYLKARFSFFLSSRSMLPPLPCHQQIVKKESWIWKGLLKSRDRFRVIQV